jgi:hypothetical protein
MVYGIFALITTIYSIPGRQLCGMRPRTQKSKTAGPVTSPAAVNLY